MRRRGKLQKKETLTQERQRFLIGLFFSIMTTLGGNIVLINGTPIALFMVLIQHKKIIFGGKSRMDLSLSYLLRCPSSVSAATAGCCGYSPRPSEKGVGSYHLVEGLLQEGEPV